MFTTTVFQILGIIYLSFLIKIIMDPKSLESIIDSYIKNPSQSVVSWMIGIGVGMGILANYSTWSWEWNTLITFVGWAATIKGIILIVAPAEMFGSFRRMRTKQRQTLYTILVAVLAVLCSYLGFMA